MEYTYSFSGWSPAVDPVVMNDATYTAQYVRTPIVNPDTPVLGGTGVLPTNDEKTYEVVGKWYLDKDGELKVFSLNGAFEEFGTTLYLGNAEVAAIDTNKTLAHTVYITGSGTQDDPYIFYTNYLYGKSSVTNINGSGTSFSMEGVHPGDGFYGNARVNVDTHEVTFMADPEFSSRPSGGTYIGVGKNNYGYAYSVDHATAYQGHGPYDFDNGKYTLYYLGTNDNDAYVFTIEPLAAHPDFVTEFTVRWYNGNTQLAVEQYARDATPVYKGETPTKDEDENYTYDFDGWDPHLMPVTRDIIYNAKFKAYPKPPSDPIEDIAWVFPTDGVLQYDLEHMYYRYNDQTLLFPGKGFIEEDGNGHITVCGVIVADIVEHNDADTISTFVHTVYVSGTGSYYNPFVFHPNYEYHGPKSIIPNGASLAVGEENIFATTTTIVTYPGDSYKGNTRLRVGNTPAKFLPDDAYHQADDRFLGVGETTYGYSYDREIASPYTFSSANGVLYYHGEDDYGYVFAEEPAEFQQSFGDPTTYTVTWKNYDGTVIDTDTCYYNDIPSFDGNDPEKPGYSRFTFTFSGWTDENEVEYAKDEELPAVIGDITYTAAYTMSSKLFVLHSLSLNGDIGVNFYLDVTPEEIDTGSGVVVNFSWNVEGNIKRSSYKLSKDEFTTKNGKTYYKATCWVAAAEMTYNIHATATINGALEEETDDYNVREYALTIINSPEGTFENQDNLVTLVKTMLDYGAKAQIRFSRKTNDLANYGTDYFTGEVTIQNKASDMDEGLEDFGLEYAGTSVVYLTETSLRHYYIIKDSAKFNAVKGSITFDGVSVNYVTKSGKIYFEKKNIAASQLDTEYVFSINGHDYQYSVLDYSALSASLDEAPYEQSISKQLASAVYRYNEAANVYFNN